MREPLCDCGRTARFKVMARTITVDLLSYETIEHPEDAYEEDLMTDFMCAHCAIESKVVDLCDACGWKGTQIGDPCADCGEDHSNFIWSDEDV